MALRVLPGDPSHWGLPSPLPGGAVFLVGACVLWVPSALRAVEMGVGVLGISRESFREVRRDQGPRGAPVLGFHPLDAPQNMWPPEKVWAE